MPIHRDPLGQVIPHGKVTRSKVADFLDGTMPPWLEASAGTASFVTPAAAAGHLQVTSAAVLDGTATLRTAFEFDPQHFKAVAWTVEGFSLSTDTEAAVFMSIGDAPDATRGAVVYHLATQANPRLSGRGSGTGTAIAQYQIRSNGEGVKRRNLTLLWLPADDEAYLLTGDQPIVHLKHAGFNPVGLCRASISVQTKAATAHHFRVAQVKLDLTHN